MVGNAVCNNLKHPFLSTAVNWTSQTIGIVPTIFLFARWLGAPGVLIGREIGGVLFALVSFGSVQWVFAIMEAEAKALEEELTA